MDPPLPPEHYLDEPDAALETQPRSSRADPLLSPMASLTVHPQSTVSGVEAMNTTESEVSVNATTNLIQLSPAPNVQQPQPPPPQNISQIATAQTAAASTAQLNPSQQSRSQSAATQHSTSGSSNHPPPPLMANIVRPPANIPNRARRQQQQGATRQRGAGYGRYNYNKYQRNNAPNQRYNGRGTNQDGGRNSGRYGKRTRSPVRLDENSARDKLLIRMDLERFLIESYGLRPANHLTLEKLVDELKKA